MSQRSEQILRIMEGLHCSAAEAMKIYEDDLAIDRGEKVNFGLDAQAEKEAIKNAHKGTKSLNLPRKERKPNFVKSAVIIELVKVLQNSKENAYSDIKIANYERQIDFYIGENSFSLTLTQHRTKRNVH